MSKSIEQKALKYGSTLADNGWISVDDRKPETVRGLSETVLVWTVILEIGEPYSAYYNRENGNWLSANETCIPGKITHWTTINPPKGQEK